MRVRMLKYAAGQELARVTAVDQQSANLGRRQHTSTAVLAATDPNFLVHGSPAVANGMSYCCCGPPVQEVGVCRGEHGRGCVLSSAQICGLLAYCCNSRQLLPCGRFSMRTRIVPSPWCPLRVDGCSSDLALTKSLPLNARKMACFVLIFEWGKKIPYVGFKVCGWR